MRSPNSRRTSMIKWRWLPKDGARAALSSGTQRNIECSPFNRRRAPSATRDEGRYQLDAVAGSNVELLAEAPKFRLGACAAEATSSSD